MKKNKEIKENMPIEEKTSKLLSKILLIIVIVCIAIAGIFSVVYVKELEPVDPDNEEQVEFKVESGWGANKIADELEDQGLIKNAFFFKVYVKIDGKDNFLAGTYKLSKSMPANSIIETLTSGNSLENETITVTFVEGKRFPYYVQKIADNFNTTYDEVMATLTDQDYLKELINKYDILTDEILDENIYYPLEGYLFPDTYTFKKNATVKEVAEKMISEMQDKLSDYDDEIKLSGQSIHSLLTMASMVELEAKSAEDRAGVAGVFYNRINSNMKLGSDVTAYYGGKKELTDSDKNTALSLCNGYNTREAGCRTGLPVGPICSPSLTSIIASINPTESSYLYFVADSNLKVYFAYTNEENLANKASLKKQGLWPE